MEGTAIEILEVLKGIKTGLHILAFFVGAVIGLLIARRLD